MVVGNGGGGESQGGGLPSLEDRIEQDEALIAALQTKAADLQGQNNWAVVAFDGTLVRSQTSAGKVTAERIGAGQYVVTFASDVSGCAYEATIGDTDHAVPTQGQISVSGDTDSDNPGDVFVQTFDKTGATPIDSPFYLCVSCP
ncbi:MAG: hypothetical protein ACLQDV_17480 [Candidatus Binataceae bacterium]